MEGNEPYSARVTSAQLLRADEFGERPLGRCRVPVQVRLGGERFCAVHVDPDLESPGTQGLARERPTAQVEADLTPHGRRERVRLDLGRGIDVARLERDRRQELLVGGGRDDRLRHGLSEGTGVVGASAVAVAGRPMWPMRPMRMAGVTNRAIRLIQQGSASDFLRLTAKAVYEIGILWFCRLNGARPCPPRSTSSRCSSSTRRP